MDNTTETPNKKGFPKLLIIIGAVFAVILSALIVCLSIIIYASRPITVEVGTSFSLSKITDNSLISAVCSAKDAEIDTDTWGDYKIGLKFFGLIDRELHVFVRDTLPPEVELYDVCASYGAPLTGNDFVRSISDASDTVAEFAGDGPDTTSVGKSTVSISVTDSSGNVTIKEAALEVTDESTVIHVEFGDTDCSDDIAKIIPDAADVDISSVDLSKIGVYAARSYSDNVLHIYTVAVNDTVPPKARSVNRILRKGETVEAKDLLTHVVDASEVQIRFETEVDFTKLGVQNVGIVMEDAAGNVTELITQIEICDLPESVTLEYGFSREELENAVFSGKLASDYSMAFADVDILDSLDVGEHEVLFKGAMGEIKVALTVKDTVAPVLVLRELSVAVGKSVTPEDFVLSCTDSSPVEYSFANAPSVDSVGTVSVTVIATDSSGNSASATALLHVGKNAAPPVIYGIKDLSIVSPYNISYVRGVYALDCYGASVAVTVDSSDVNVDVNGVYTVKYTAIDSAGNKTEATAKVTVNIVSLEDSVNATADKILASIINESMSPREKAWAIYSWSSSNIRYSNATAYLMGQFYEGANSGFTIRRGNCYIYYAVTSVLLTRAGIENIEIQRNDPSNPHYWNLVKIDGNWYHLDACPHFAGHKMTAFLLTDAEVKAYSQNEVKDYYSFDPSLYPATP